MTAGEWFALGVQSRVMPQEFCRPARRACAAAGPFGPAFITYPNFNIYLEWNQSFVYTTSAAYFATRLMGARTLTRRATRNRALMSMP